MSINIEYIKSKVIGAIEQLPSDGIVLREVLNKFKEKEGYCIVANLKGVLYSETNNKTDIILNNNGVNLNKENKKYLIVFDEEAEKLKQTDIIFIDNLCYKISDIGENLKIYCEMKLEKHEGLKMGNNIIIEDECIYEIITLPLDLRFGDWYEIRCE